MDQLRIILIVLGIVLVAGIWIADRIRRRRAMKPSSDWNEIESYNEDAVSEEDMYPSLDDQTNPDEWVGKAFSAKRHDVLDDAHLEGLKGMASDGSVPEQQIPILDEVVEFAEPQPSATPETEQDAQPEEVIVLTLLAEQGKRLRGPLLLKALQECGLSHGDMEIFHYSIEGHSEPMFSVANVLEPGKFVLSEMAQMETPGIALFMRLPTQMPGSEALQQMLHKARQLGAQLNANLCDGQRQPLDDATLAQLEARAQPFQAIH